MDVEISTALDLCMTVSDWVFFVKAGVGAGIEWVGGRGMTWANMWGMFVGICGSRVRGSEARDACIASYTSFMIRRALPIRGGSLDVGR